MNLLTKHIFVLFLMLFSMVVKAEDPGLKFDPQRFQIALEQFIVKEAGLSPQESAHFFRFIARCKISNALSLFR